MGVYTRRDQAVEHAYKTTADRGVLVRLCTVEKRTEAEVRVEAEAARRFDPRSRVQRRVRRCSDCRQLSGG